jgi:4-hydroxybenzoate polyprenyltransferase
VQYGAEKAAMIVVVSLAFSLVFGLAVLRTTERPFPILYILCFVLIGVGLLILPAYRLHKTKDRTDALTLFKRASYYPLACLILVAIKILAGH